MDTAIQPYVSGSLAERAGGLMASPQQVALALMDAQMIVVVDCSGSMSAQDAGENENEQRSICAQNSLSDLQKQFPAQIAVGAFNTNAHGLVPSGILPEPAGGTPMFAAMNFFYPKAIQTQKKFVLISDGEPTDDGPGCIEMARQNGYPIYAIYVGSYSNTAGGKDFMRRLAEASGGTFDFINLKQMYLLESKLAGLLTATAGAQP